MPKKNNRVAKNLMNFNTSTFNKDPKDVAKNLKNYISPVQLTRLRQDVASWRDAIAEAEKAYYPFRVKMQRIYIDTVLNGHCFSLMERRKDLTLLRNYKICDKDGVEAPELTAQLQAQYWFNDFISYCLDAIFFGYSLISLGDIVNDEMQESTIIPRWFISPDRHEVGSYIYASSGKDFREEPQADWHVYVKTKSDNGVSPCGYGLLYQIALYEIVLRNTLGFNADFAEMYAMPYRVGKTTKTSEAERAQLEAAIKNMGSAGYALIDSTDDIQFLEASIAGTGYHAYESLEARCQKIVSKIILGHADAVDSTPGKLGSGQGSKDGTKQDGSPVAMALADKQSRDARFIEPIINNLLLPKLKAIGFKGINIPDGYHFEYTNDSEDEEFRKREDDSNLQTAMIAQTMKNAGLQMDSKYFEERTGIPATVSTEKPMPVFNNKIKNKLDELYR
jgi:phage gp29-like protein